MAADSALAGTAPGDTSGGVPVPSPTEALGDKPGGAELAAAAGGVALAADSLAGGAPQAAGAPAKSGSPSTTKPATSGAAPGSAPVAAAGAAGASATSKPDPCYRLQVAAPADRSQADSMKRAAESQLELPFTVTKVQTLYKVRTRDCLDAQAAEHLRARARASGFSGAFTVTEATK